MTLTLGHAWPPRNLRLFPKPSAAVVGVSLLLGSALLFPQFALAQNAAVASPTSHVLSLSQAIDRATTASPKLEAAASGIAAAAGSERQANLYPNPQASLQVENFGGSGPLRGFRSIETTAGVSQLIEMGGKRDAR